ncbi:hypothetical protein K470DRAFT_260567 [Piedraia hortae CBS 480.64]|uniref:Uncharacterized protein n=1 Tax=Piedraia hortae CBS 480.64 TaxID=1314780 RepID=A0A6A7BRY4_9PEZI|nr:hypothetical protein K470DRAFT_260567 [Piedraia hortae CBS 480.64]
MTSCIFWIPEAVLNEGYEVLRSLIATLRCPRALKQSARLHADLGESNPTRATLTRTNH